MDKEVTRYFPDGTIESVYFVQNERRHGLCRQWNEQGQLIYEGRFYDGLQEGRHREFYNNGIIFTEKHYKKGLLSGRSKAWYCSGQIQSKEWYVQGKLHGKQYYWTEKGKRVSTTIQQVAFL